MVRKRRSFLSAGRIPSSHGAFRTVPHPAALYKDRNPTQQLLQLEEERGTSTRTDQGSVYATKSYNELLPMYNIVRSMSRAGTPTDNAAMEAINGWIKAELFTDFHITSPENVPAQVSDYIRFFNEERPAYALGYLTPKQYRERFAPKHEGAAP